MWLTIFCQAGIANAESDKLAVSEAFIYLYFNPLQDLAFQVP